MTFDPHTRYPDDGEFSGDEQMSRNDDEMLQRVRRIETRLTQLMLAQGVSTQAQKPKFDSKTSTLQVPSRHTSLMECTKAIPNGWDRPVRILVGGDLVAVLAGLGNPAG